MVRTSARAIQLANVGSLFTNIDPVTLLDQARIRHHEPWRCDTGINKWRAEIWQAPRDLTTRFHQKGTDEA